MSAFAFAGKSPDTALKSAFRRISTFRSAANFVAVAGKADIAGRGRKRRSSPNSNIGPAGGIVLS